MLKKTIKFACSTCVVLGAVAVVGSGKLLKAVLVPQKEEVSA